MLLRVIVAGVAIAAISNSSAAILGASEVPLACCSGEIGECPSDLVCCGDPSGDCSTEKIGYCRTLCIPPAR